LPGKLPTPKSQIPKTSARDKRADSFGVWSFGFCDFTGALQLCFRWHVAFHRGVNTFDRHLLREWLKVLGLVLAASLGDV
jgi:hypothetical protein